MVEVEPQCAGKEPMADTNVDRPIFLSVFLQVIGILRDVQAESAVRHHLGSLVKQAFINWVDAARVFPPPLLEASDSESEASLSSSTSTPSSSRRTNARANYYWTVELNRQLQASKGKGKGSAKEHAHGTVAASKGQQKGKSVTPKSWSQMTRDEKWWLQALWEGTLLAEMRRAEGKCKRVQAKDFAVDEET